MSTAAERSNEEAHCRRNAKEAQGTPGTIPRYSIPRLFRLSYILKKLELARGIEPPTCGLQNRCSAIELRQPARNITHLRA